MSMIWYRAFHEYEYAMRVDEDVCLTRVPEFAFTNALTTADYAFGLDTTESHRETVETFSPFVRDYLSATGLHPRIPPLPTERMFFTNFFLARISFWRTPGVQHFLHAVNASSGTYRHRCGDAPIQTAALRLHASPIAVHHLRVDYVQCAALRCEPSSPMLNPSDRLS